MAGDWIKMRVSLWTHPKVVTLSSQLCVTRAHAIGALHCAWSIADQHADENGRVNLTPDSLDKLTETNGFSAAMAKIGWIVLSDESMQFVNYQEHNSTTAKKRADAQNRQRLSRTRHKSVTTKRDKSVTREEKRREEKNTPSPLSLPFDSEAFKTSWGEWELYRRDAGKPIKPATKKKQFKFLGGLGEALAIEAIDASIRNGWSGLFPPKDEKGKPKEAGPKREPEIDRMRAETERVLRDQAERAKLNTPSEDDDAPAF